MHVIMTADNSELLCVSGYIPDTDSDLGTRTLNSPQEWTEKGVRNGNRGDHGTVSAQKTVFSEYKGKCRTMYVGIKTWLSGT